MNTPSNNTRMTLDDATIDCIWDQLKMIAKGIQVIAVLALLNWFFAAAPANAQTLGDVSTANWQAQNIMRQVQTNYCGYSRGLEGILCQVDRVVRITESGQQMRNQLQSSQRRSLERAFANNPNAVQNDVSYKLNRLCMQGSAQACQAARNFVPAAATATSSAPAVATSVATNPATTSAIADPLVDGLRRLCNNGDQTACASVGRLLSR